MKADDLTTQTEAALAQRGIRPTAVRLLVAKALATAECALSLTDLEARLGTVDKSSIFRVLTLFLEHDVVHSFEDGRGILNYELCRSDGKCSQSDNHVHFYCESCQRSFCLDDIHIHDIPLPDGFYAHSLSFVVKGECAECRRKNHNQ